MEAFNDIYVRYFQPENGTMNQVFYVQWVQKVGADRCSPVHFENYILNCKEYNEYLKRAFVDVWCRYLDKQSYTDEIFREYIRTAQQNKLVSIEVKNITAHIKSHSLFQNKYSEMVARLFKLVNDETIPDNILKGYMDNLTNSDYTLENLNEDILSNKAPHARANNLLASINESWKSIHTLAPRATDIETIIDTLSNSQRNISAIVYSMNMYHNAENQQLISNFENIFERDITAHEFLKYIQMWLSKPDRVAWLKSVKDKHDSDYAVIRNLHYLFMNSELTENEYIKTYLHAIDEEGYADIVTSNLVTTDNYSRLMRAKIRGLHNDLYRVELDTPDEVYIFERIRLQRINLTSSEIAEQVTAVKNETDAYVTAMKAVYSAILEREPDILEWRAHLTSYRATANSEKTDALLRDELYNGYEYHDILKQRIRDAFKAAKGHDPLPSQQFALLKLALANMTIARDMKLLKKTVETFAS